MAQVNTCSDFLREKGDAGVALRLRDIVALVDEAVATLSLESLNRLLTWRPLNLSFTPHEAGHRERARTNASFTEPNQEKYMKRLALVAVVLVAACSTKETPKADTAAPAMAPAPAPVAVDTTAKADSAMAAMKMDTAKAKMDTASKKVDEAKGAVKDAAKAAKKP